MGHRQVRGVTGGGTSDIRLSSGPGTITNVTMQNGSIQTAGLFNNTGGLTITG